jgi:NTP pyrophosphatase (non-canonical NTP hydrolase)
MQFEDIVDKIYDEYLKNDYHYMWESTKPYPIGIIAELGLIITEVAECMEVIRKYGESYRTIRARIEIQEELADIIIRTMNLASRLNIRLENRILEKNKKNLERGTRHGKEI